MKGIILLGHGSRDPLWRKPMEAVAVRIAELAPGVTARCAYLELDRPDLEGAATELIASGARSLSVLPIFLGAGRHVRDDLPDLVERVRIAHPDIAVHLKTAVGEDARVLDLLAAIALE